MPRAVVDGDTRAHHRRAQLRLPQQERFHGALRRARSCRSRILTGVDFYVSFWMEGPIGHTFLSFMFDNAPPLSVSIETRPEVGEGYSPIASMFKQYELIYVVGDERDLVRLRTNYRDEEVFLYHLTVSPEAARRLFLVYLERINELYDAGRSGTTCSATAAPSTSSAMRTSRAGPADSTSATCSTA